MKVSIITVVYNNRDTIRDAIESVLTQKHDGIEYIIVDGASTDGTLEIIREYGERIAKVVSEKDNGLYDAMNKGIRLCTGDIVGMLNADDFYLNDQVIPKIVDTFQKQKTDCVFADLVFVPPDDPERIVRYYRSHHFHPDKFAYGWMPAHPTLFLKRNIYEQFGLFQTDYQIAADFEILARFLYKHRISYSYLPEILVKMRTGGSSTKSWRSNWILNKEIKRACQENGIPTHFGKIYSKYFRKILELIIKPSITKTNKN